MKLTAAEDSATEQTTGRTNGVWATQRPKLNLGTSENFEGSSCWRGPIKAEILIIHPNISSDNKFFLEPKYSSWAKQKGL